MKTAAIVVTYNKCDMLLQCLCALEAQTVPCHIYIIDNASTDSTQSLLEENASKNLRYLRLETNTGGAGGFYAGCAQAIADGFEYLWLMDDDTLPNPTALEALQKAAGMLSGSWGWLSSKALWTDGQLCAMNIQRENPFKDLDVSHIDRPHPAQIASFVSLLVPTSVIRAYGLPIPEFFIWGDDWEFTRRISRHLPCYMIPDSVVTHAMRENIPSNIAVDSASRLPRYRYSYRNDVYLYRQEGLRGWLWLLCKNGWHSLRVLLFGHKPKAQRIHIIWAGFGEGCHFAPPIRYPNCGESEKSQTSTTCMQD